MRQRILIALAATALIAGCSSEPSSDLAVAEGKERIACALRGDAGFREACSVERTQRDGVLTLTVRHPDGAFRRFMVVRDGRGLIAADGAEQVATEVRDGKLAVTIGGDRYLFPATLKDRDARI